MTLLQRIETGMTTADDAERVRDLEYLATLCAGLNPDAGEIGDGMLREIAERGRRCWVAAAEESGER